MSAPTEPFDRPGRATFVLRRDADSAAWRPGRGELVGATDKHGGSRRPEATRGRDASTRLKPRHIKNPSTITARMNRYITSVVRIATLGK